MRLVRNSWTPDTCDSPGCKIEYEWDDDDPQGFDNRQVVNIMNRCPAHATEPVASLYATCMEENSRKNVAMNRIQELYPALFDPVMNTPDPAKLVWAFDATRELDIQTPGLLGAEKASLRTELGTLLGNRKFKVR